MELLTYFTNLHLAIQIISVIMTSFIIGLTIFAAKEILLSLVNLLTSFFRPRVEVKIETPQQEKNIKVKKDVAGELEGDVDETRLNLNELEELK